MVNKSSSFPLASSSSGVSSGLLATFDSMSYPNGAAGLILKVTDKVGNASTVTRNIAIDNDRTPPAASISVVNAGSAVNPGATATEGNLDIAVSATANY